MKRRELITLLGVAGVPMIGYLSSRSPDTEATMRTPILVALEEVLVATDRPSTLAVKAATTTIPIVFGVGEDPVQFGLVASLSRPSGNATGVSVFTNELGPKRFSVLRELVSKPGLIAFLINPNTGSTTPQVESLKAAAQSVAQPLLLVPAGTEAQVDEAFATMAQRNVAGIVYGASVFFRVVRDKLIALAAKYAIPAIYEWRVFVAAGGLMSYSTDRTEIGRHIGSYAGRILKGANPADLPVVQSTKFKLLFNLKTAKALGLTVPPSLLARADEVIE